MTSSQICIMVVIALYLLAMVVVGYVYSKKTKNVSDFYLGGRKLGPLVTAMSAEASDMSSYLLMGLPGLAYLSGLADVGWTAIGLAVGTYLNWLLVARRIRLYSNTIGAITIPDFFSRRFHDSKKSLSCIAAIIIIVFFVPYTGSGFAACGKLFSNLFGISYMKAMLISALVIVAYTSLGGFNAASTTDLVQSIFMTIALIVVVCFGISHAGGIGTVVENAKALPGYLSMTSTHDAASGSASAYGPITILSTLAWGLGYFGMPHILLRFMAIEDDAKLKVSRRIGSVWVVISMGIAICIGIIGLGMVKAGSLAALADSETIIIDISSLMSTYGVVPAIVAGIILSGILASTMSTADSQLLAASSSVSQDLLHNVLGLNITKKSEMRIARLTVLGIALVGVVIARNPDSNVFKIVSFAWAGFGAAFGPVVLLALFWKRANRQGALAGMVAGGVMVFVWKFLVRPMGGIWNIYELLPAFIVALIAMVVGSLVTPAPEKSIVEEFESVRDAMKK